MDGVNQELMPLVKMTVPADVHNRSISEAPVGELAFRSWLLLGGALPFDRHALKLERIKPGEQFIEESDSWMQKRWRHVRTLEDIDGGCRLTDEVTFTPRIRLLAPVAARLVDLVFSHRHDMLREKFGPLP